MRSIDVEPLATRWISPVGWSRPEPVAVNVSDSGLRAQLGKWLRCGALDGLWGVGVVGGAGDDGFVGGVDEAGGDDPAGGVGGVGGDGAVGGVGGDGAVGGLQEPGVDTGIEPAGQVIVADSVPVVAGAGIVSTPAPERVNIVVVPVDH